MTELTRKDERDFYKTLTIEEKKAIFDALKDIKPWSIDNNLIGNVKKKIREFHLNRMGHKCCYCRTPLKDRNIETDREHIIPKSMEKKLSYNIFNLSVSCKRCNMTYKGDTEEHIVNKDNLIRKLRDSTNYYIPHPNIDSYDDNIFHFHLISGEIEVCFYKPRTPKGEILSSMFLLKNLETFTLDKSQAPAQIKTLKDELSAVKCMIDKLASGL